MWKPSTYPAWYRQTIHTPCEYLSLWCGCYTLAEGKPHHQHTCSMPQTCLTPSCILFSHFHTHRTKLQYLWERTTGCHKSPSPLETLPWLEKNPFHHLHRPCQPPVLEISQKPELLNSQVACRPPGIWLHPGIHPWEDQHHCRCPIPTTWEGSWRRGQQGCHHHSPILSLSSQNPRRANNST